MPKYTSKYNSHCHIDTLHLSFDTIDHRNYFHVKSNYYTILPITTKIDYSLSFEIYTMLNNETIHFATLHHLNSNLPKYSTLTLINYSFVHSSWSNILNHIIFDLHLDISIRKMEIAIDTNKNILKKLHTVYMKTDNLLINDSRYDFDNYGKTKFVKSQGYKNYFNHTATQYLANTKTETKSQYDRFENKRNEIDQQSNKYYIDKYLLPYFDTTLPYFRWEKTLFFEDLTYTNPVYINTSTGETLSNYMWTKLPNAIKYSYEKSIEYSKLDIDFSQLENPDYLISLFNNFSLFNHDVVFDTYKNAPHFKRTYVKKYKVVTPTVRSISIEVKKQAILTLSEEFDRINDLYIMSYDTTPEEVDIRAKDILFETHIPSMYFYQNRE